MCCVWCVWCKVCLPVVVERIDRYLFTSLSHHEHLEYVWPHRRLRRSKSKSESESTIMNILAIMVLVFLDGGHWG